MSQNSDQLENANLTVEFNPIFEKTVLNSGDPVRGAVAYATYKKAKWEWAQQIAARHGRAPTQAELQAYVDTWTPSQLKNIWDNGGEILSAYSNQSIRDAEPAILRRALKGNFWRSVISGMVAAFAYTALLILTTIILAKSGVDLIGILESTTSTSFRSPIAAD